MRAGLAFAASILTLGPAACAGSPDGPLETDRMRLTALEVAADPTTDRRYPAFLRYEVSGEVRVIDSCFTWIDEGSFLQRHDDWTGLGDGPYCLVPESAGLPGIVQTLLVSGYPGSYRLVAYTRYEGGGTVRTTNAVAQQVTVTRRLP